MPKTLDYPRAPLKACLELASAVEDLGGRATDSSIADSMGRKVSGAFKAIIGAAMKYDLIRRPEAGSIATTDLAKTYIDAYNDEERRECVRKAIMNVPVFNDVLTRFAGRKLPTDMMEKLLLREYGVQRAIAGRVAGYLAEAVDSAGLLNSDGTLSTSTEEEAVDATDEEEAPPEHTGLPHREAATMDPTPPDADTFTVRITGPGVNSTIEINEPEDLLILDAFISKIKRLLNE